jgi:DNA modification methylase
MMIVPYFQDECVTLYQGDCRVALAGLDEESVACCVTSPPYWGLRDYGNEKQIGLEETLENYVATLVEVFHETRRVLRRDGVLWLNLGDAYNAYNGNRGPSRGKVNRRHHEFMPALPKGHGLTCKTLKAKDLIGIPWRVALALQRDGWYLRGDVIWHKPNPTPERVKDRPHRSHEYLFLLTRSDRYSFVLPKDRRTSVWTVPTKPYKGHRAVFPPQLIEPCILAASRPGDVVLDPFAGSGTTLATAAQTGRKAVGAELNPDYCALIVERLRHAHSSHHEKW